MCYSILPILVNKVPVLSNEILFAFFIFSKMLLFFINIPLFVARFRIIAITLGTARPRAQGQEATKTPIPLSTTQQTLHIGTVTQPISSNTDQTIIVNTLKIITPRTKILEIFLHTA